jgi:hypothetical protein
MHIVRAICLAVHWPCVNSQQAGAYQHSRGEFIVLLCSALRGAVGLSLAMEVCPPPPGPPIAITQVWRMWNLGLVQGARKSHVWLFCPSKSLCGEGTALPAWVRASSGTSIMRFRLPT